MSSPLPVDPTKPSIARVYNSFFDLAGEGKDNFAVDRELRDAVLRIAPETREVAYALRAWLTRAVGYLAGPAGVDQFLDLGSGLPNRENTHEVAQRKNPEASVVYIDNDPAVAAYGRAILEENDRTYFAVADLTDPAEVLGNEVVAKRLDWTRPIGLLQCATLHHVADELNPRALMSQYIEALPPGSYVGITHWWDPEDNGQGTETARSIEAIYQSSAMVSAARYRTRAEIEALLPGLTLLPPNRHTDEPGLSMLHEWWPDGPQQEEPSLVAQLVLGGLGYKSHDEG